MKFKKCDSCGEEMEMICLFRLGLPELRVNACPQCHKPELERYSPFRDSSLSVRKRLGAYGIG
jgi:hypothetical protein